MYLLHNQGFKMIRRTSAPHILNRALGAIKMNKDFTMTGGLRTEHMGAAFPFNMTNASWPFASLTATKSGILLRSFEKIYDIEKPKIAMLRKHRGLFSVGLRISHSIKDIPPGFIFWTFNFKKLKQNLELLGYEVTV